MPGKCCAILFLFVFNTNSFAQNIAIDSLKALWNDETQADTVRLKVMHKIAWEGYLFTQPDSAFYYAQLQYEFAEKKGLKRQMGDALNTQGASYYLRGDYANAIDYYTRSLKIKEEIGDKKGMASSFNNIGNIYLDQRNYTKATDYYMRSLKIMEEIGDKREIAGTLNNIGNIYNDQRDFSKAIDYYARSLKIREDMGDKKGIAGSLNNIGLIFKSQGDYTNAIDYHTRSLKIREDISDKQGIAISLNNIGIIYKDKGDYTKAINYSTHALERAQELGIVREIKDAANNLYMAYEYIGNLRASLEMYKLYITMRDSMENIETQREVIRQEFKYNYEKQALARQSELDREANQRNILYIGLAFLLVLLGVYLRIKSLKKQAEKEVLLQQIKLLKAESLVKMKVGSSAISDEQLQLNKEKIETAIDASLNQSDWSILKVLYQIPIITNSEIADEVSLSIEGVKSSLKKMYRLFNITKSSENKRISLVIEAAKLSS